MKLKDACSLEASYDRRSQHIKKQRHHFANRSPCGQSYGFSSSHVQIWELDQKEGWAPKNWCFQIVVLEKTHESPLNSKEIKPVNPKRNQLRLFIGRTDAEASILWPPNVKTNSMEKTLKLGKTEGKKEKGVEEDYIASLTQCTWIWTNSSKEWRTEEPGVLQSTGLQRVNTT